MKNRNPIKKIITGFNNPLLFLILLLALLIIPPACCQSKKKFSVTEKVRVLWNNKWQVATVLEVGDGKYKVHFEDNDLLVDRWVSEDTVKFFAYKKGDMIYVQKDGKWYICQVLAVGTAQLKVHYVGMESQLDEWIGPNRVSTIVYSVGDGVKVYWNDQWYPASILDIQGGKYLVHYTGMPDDCDEWITIDRIKTPWMK